MCPKVCSSYLKFIGYIYIYQKFKGLLTTIIIIYMAVEGNNLSHESLYRAALQLPKWRILCRHVYAALLTCILQPITSCAKRKWRQLLSSIVNSLECVSPLLNKVQNLENIHWNSSFIYLPKAQKVFQFWRELLLPKAIMSLVWMHQATELCKRIVFSCSSSQTFLIYFLVDWTPKTRAE